MLPEIEHLLILQDRDQKIRRLKRQQAQIPAERARLEEGINSADTTLEAARAESRQNEVERKQLEIDIGAKNGSIARFRLQQLQTRKNEEYQALAHEIERCERDISEIETQELILMERADEIAKRLHDSQAESERARAELAARVGELETRASNIAAELGRLESERREFAAKVDEDLLEQYDRIFASKGDTAVASVQHGVCGGCHMKISANTAFHVRTATAVVHCDNCGRILYPSDP